MINHFSYVQLFATPCTVACQASLSMEFSRQQHWRGSPCPPPGDLPYWGNEHASFTSPALASGFFTISAAWEALNLIYKTQKRLTENEFTITKRKSSVQFGHTVMSNSLQPHGLQQARPPCPSPTPGDYTNSRPLSRWCHPTIWPSVVPFSSCLRSFPASGSFPMSQFFMSGGQSIIVSASASVLPMNIQDWFPLGWTGWISLQSKGLSRVFSNTTLQKYQFFSTQLSL